jgi:hypothetical protein
MEFAPQSRSERIEGGGLAARSTLMCNIIAARKSRTSRWQNLISAWTFISAIAESDRFSFSS